MNLGRVVGTVVSTSKDENLEGVKLLIVQYVDIAMKPTSSFAVAADGIGAGETELVMVVTGSSARMATRVKNRPIDAAIVGIIDRVDVEGTAVYRKEADYAKVPAAPAASGKK